MWHRGLNYVRNGKVMRLIESHFSLDFTYALIFVQLVHISFTEVKQEMDKMKDREKWFVTLSYVIPVVCVTNEREESVVNQHN